VLSLPSNRPKPFAREEVVPGPVSTWDLFGETRQQLFDAPVRPLEEHLGDQIVGGRVAVVSNESIGDPSLTSAVNIEDSERDSEALRQSSAVPYR
jgi:hypothetical protein